MIGYNNGKQAVVSVTLGTTLTANFGADGMLSGSAGCDDYTAPYRTDGKRSPAALAGKISIGPAATTRKMCAEPPNIMEQETQFLQALSSGPPAPGDHPRGPARRRPRAVPRRPGARHGRPDRQPLRRRVTARTRLVKLFPYLLPGAHWLR